jgi:hypothetical protein
MHDRYHFNTNVLCRGPKYFTAIVVLTIILIILIILVIYT